MYNLINLTYFLQQTIPQTSVARATRIMKDAIVTYSTLQSENNMAYLFILNVFNIKKTRLRRWTKRGIIYKKNYDTIWGVVETRESVF